MKLSEIKNKDITIQNIGKIPLDIRNFSTSCGCVSVQVITKSEKSPEFSMHNNSSWYEEIQPNEIATLKITYQPKIMPVQGEVSRDIYFKTNDPALSEVTIKFNAYVE